MKSGVKLKDFCDSIAARAGFDVRPIVNSHRSEAGTLIGERDRIFPAKYAAWMIRKRLQSEQNTMSSEPKLTRAEKNRIAMNRKSRAKQNDIREIGSIPDVANPQRRERAEKDFALWRATYCTGRHDKADSINHPRMCDRLQDVVESLDGWFAMEAPRGEGKTNTITEALAWAIATGRKRFPICFASSGSLMDPLAEMFGTVFTDLDPVKEDYPEICYPLDFVGDAQQRRPMFHGKPIKLVWNMLNHGKKVFRFPRIPGSPSNSSALIVSPIFTKSRGFALVDDTGKPLRPDLVFFDDIQDEEIANNPDRIKQCWDRMVISAAGLSGGYPLSLLNSGTPFHDDCLMSRTMNDRRFNGVVFKSIYQFPSKMELWEKYLKIWEESYDENVLKFGIFEKNKANAEAFRTASMFYQNHREDMDAGIEMSWPAMYKGKGSGVSAIENIMREYLIGLGPEAFLQEKNCEAKSRVSDDIEKISEETFMEKIDHSLKEFVSPKEADLITFAIDVHLNILVCEGVAWSQGFDGHVITYGVFPGQNTSHFTQKNAKQTLQKKYPKAGVNGALLKGLNELTEEIMSRKYYREDGTEIYVDKIIVDNNNGDFMSTVEQFASESEHRGKIVLYRGFWYAQGTQHRKQTDTGGPEWRWDANSGKTVVNAFRDFWKTHNLYRWLTPRGEAGTKTIYAGGLQRHRKFFDELTAQNYTNIFLQSGAQFKRWPQKFEGEDHFGDTDFMNGLAASVCKITLDAEKGKQRRGRKKINLNALQEKRRDEW